MVVVGGGFAGAAAASALTESGVTVTLLERRPTLGGRTSSFRDGVTREEADNGQHLFMGCYKEVRRFLRRLKVGDRVQFFPSLDVKFLSPAGAAELACPVLAGHLGVLWGIGRYGAMSVGDRFSVLRALSGLRLRKRWGDLKNVTVSQWLAALRQPAGARRAFWTPLCLATLNERPEKACAEALAVVLREGFFSDSSSSAVGYCTVALGKLWSVELFAYLKRQGGVVASRQAARGFEAQDDLVRSVRMESGEKVEADAVVCAVPLPDFLQILPPGWKKDYQGLVGAAHSAIVSVNLWFRRPVMDELFVGLLDTPTQWLFNRYRLWQGRGVSPGYVSAVISAADGLSGKTGEELVSLVLDDLERCAPSLRREDLVHGSAVWEKHATLSPSPSNWGHRPGMRTPWRNFFLAGDWVDCGLPPTMEAAARSGHQAADAVKEFLGQRHARPPAGSVPVSA